MTDQPIPTADEPRGCLDCMGAGDDGHGHKCYHCDGQGAVVPYRPVTSPSPVVAGLLDALAAAYTAGATDAHNWWAAGNVEREADFGEAASDYARSIDLTALSTRPAPETTAEAESWLEAVASWEQAGRPRTPEEQEAARSTASPDEAPSTSGPVGMGSDHEGGV